MDWIGIIAVLQLAATMAMLGVIWVVQLCVYPRFADLDPEKFIGAHLRHCAGIGLVVTPIMLTELFTAIFLVWAGSGGRVQWLVLALSLGTFLSTAFIQAPCHRRLMQGYDQARCRSLTCGNWIRTGLWSAKALLVLALAMAPYCSLWVSCMPPFLRHSTTNSPAVSLQILTSSPLRLLRISL